MNASHAPFVQSASLALLCAIALGAAGLARLTGCERAPAPVAADADAARAGCTCEIRSWVVAGRGRHMFAKIDCPKGHDQLDTVVEFTTAAMRRDFVPPADITKSPPRVAKMNRGVRVRPALAQPDNRLEATYQITPEQARELERDRVFRAPYVLIGRNSNSALRRALADIGLALPQRVLEGGGMLGEFPGVDLDPGDEVAPDKWADVGLPRGPERAP